MNYTIYKVTNKTNGKIYIGSHKTPNLNDGYMGSGKYLKRAIEKHGIDSFVKEILFVFDTPELMYAKEAELVDEEFLTEANTYNLKVGGFGGWDYVNTNGLNGSLNALASRKKASYEDQKEWQEKRLACWREWRKSDKAKAADIRRNNTKREKYGINAFKTFLGRKHTDVTKQLISEKAKIHSKGERNSQFDTRWIYSLNEKKSVKIRKESPLPEGWIRGRKPTQQHCITCLVKITSRHAKWCDSCRPKPGKRPSTIMSREKQGKKCVVNGVEFSAASIAADATGIKHESMRYRIRSINFPEYYYLKE